MYAPDFTDTIVALATPPGIGAIGVIRMSGAQAIDIADQIFKGKKLSKQASHTAHFGRIVTADKRILDEVLVTVFRGPNSYTGEDSIEISCHGSPYILQEIIQLCTETGARLAAPGEFTMRAFLNGKLDLSQAEAVADLISSQSAAAHQVAMHQLRGGFKQEIQALREELIHFASLVELELDFSEEDVEFADRSQLRSLVEKLLEHIRSLMRSFSLGNAIKTGVTTVIAGRPNAGKSTLLNALLNEERAIVSDIAGTTRDTIEEILNIKGVQFRLIDTAGIREAQDAIEAIGVQKTLEKIGEAAILVYVWDITGSSIPEVYADLQQLALPAEKVLVICNKMDRNPYFKTEWLQDPLQEDIHPYLLGDSAPAKPDQPLFHDAIPVSAKNAMNIEYFKEKLFDLAIGKSLQTEHTVVSNARHYQSLQKTETSLAAVLSGLDSGITGDFIAQDIRHALAHLSEITGDIGVEDLLGNIFGKFCIGK